MYVKGIDGQELSCKDRSINVGANNRAFITDYANDSSSYWAYYHYFLGGTMEFDVDVSKVGCTQVQGIYMVAIDDQNCSWDEKSSAPSCASIEVMEANTVGFRAAQRPCEASGNCNNSQQQSPSGTQYGPGSSYVIDSTKPFKLSVKFYAQMDSDGNLGELEKLETTLTQGASNVTLVNDDSVFLRTFTPQLKYGMAIAVSNYIAGTTNEISGTCTQSVADHQPTTLSNFAWTVYDSIAEPPVPTPTEDVVIGGVAPSI